MPLAHRDPGGFNFDDRVGPDFAAIDKSAVGNSDELAASEHDLSDWANETSDVRR